MALDTDRLGEDVVTRGAEAGVSHLAGIPGHGTMQVVRGQRQEAIEVCGTWRPDDEETDLTALENAEKAEEPVRFEGRLDDPADADRTEVAASCRITSSSEYTFDATLPDDDTGPTLRVFNLRPIDDAAVT